MSQVTLDLSGIAAGQDGLPEPIASALSALQSAHNDTDTSLSNITTGHNHNGVNSRQLTTAALSDYVAPTAIPFSAFTGSGGNPTQGNGTWNAYYTRIGKVVTVHFAWNFGSTSVAGTGNYHLALPIATAYGMSMACLIKDASAGTYWSRVGGADAASTDFIVPVGDSTATLMGAAQPMTWATGDLFYVTGSYLVA